MTPREAFLVHLATRPACGEQSLKVWRLAHRLSGAALDALVEQLVAEGRVSVETDDRGMRKVRLAGRAPRELPPVEIETAGEEPTPLIEAAPTPPAAENKPEPADRDATVSPEAPPAPSARYAGVTAPPPEVVLPAAPEPPEVPPAVEPSPTPPPASEVREVESLDALAAPLSAAQRVLVRQMILSLAATPAAGERPVPVAMKRRSAALLAALPGPEEKPLQMAEVVRRSGLEYSSAAAGLRHLKDQGHAANPTFGYWRRA